MRKVQRSTPTKRQPRGTLQESRIRIAAERLLVEDTGAGGLSFQTLAESLDIARTAPLYYFGSKVGLLAAIAQHAFAELEKMGILQCLITQNVDNLHKRAGSQKLVEIHGNYTLIRCIECNMRYPGSEVPLHSLPPQCPKCNGILKSDTVSFGEPIPPDALDSCYSETQLCDCFIVAGTSATVYPAASFPLAVRQKGGTLIEINLYESEITPLCNISLRGPSAEVMPQLIAAIRELRQ